jgi:hypothetical protein
MAMLVLSVGAWAGSLHLNSDTCEIDVPVPAGWQAGPGDADHGVLRHCDQASLSIRLVESPEAVDLDGWTEDLRARLKTAGDGRPHIRQVEFRPVETVSFQYGRARQFDMITHMQADTPSPWTRAVVVKVAPHVALEVFLVGVSQQAYRQSLPALSAMLQGIQVRP